MTKLINLPVSGTADAAYYIGASNEDYQYNYTPVVLTPERGCLPYIIIPDGFHAVVTRFGKTLGVWDAGFYWAAPYTQIDYLVSKQYHVFDVPVKECPTSDNVMVEIDVSLVFHIKEKEEDVTAFVYQLGPEELDKMLRAFQEEAVRTMARKKKYSEIYDLMDTKELTFPTAVQAQQDLPEKNIGQIDSEPIHGGGVPLLSSKGHPEAIEMKPLQGAAGTDADTISDVDAQLLAAKKTLNRKLESYGVEVYSITITNVQLPINFKNQMEEATTFESKNIRQSKEQEYRLKVIQDDESRQQAEQRLREDLEEMKAQNNQRVAGELKITNVYMAGTDAIIASINEKMLADVRSIDAEAELKVAVLERETAVELASINAEAQAEKEKIQTECQGYVIDKHAEGALEASKLNSQALTVKAEAEGAAAKGLISKRDYEAKKVQLTALNNLSQNPNLVLTGSNKDNVVAQMVGARETALTLGLNP